VRSSEQIFHKLKQKAAKMDNFFAVYDREFAQFFGNAPVVVEVGVNHGGSLLMWRELFGPGARIIGVDIDPAVAKMREHGFEIFLGDQRSVEFWRAFFNQVGQIDVLIDDGGHTNKAQIVTLTSALPFIRDGGIILIEDVFCSYISRRGNPSRFSFMNYVKLTIDRLQTRSKFLKMPTHPLAETIYSMTIYDGIVCLHVNRALCHRSNVVHVGSDGIGALDDAFADKRLVSFETGRRGRQLIGKLPPWLGRVVIKCYYLVNDLLIRVRMWAENQSVRKYWRG